MTSTAAPSTFPCAPGPMECAALTGPCSRASGGGDTMTAWSSKAFGNGASRSGLRSWWHRQSLFYVRKRPSSLAQHGIRTAYLSALPASGPRPQRHFHCSAARMPPNHAPTLSTPQPHWNLLGCHVASPTSRHFGGHGGSQCPRSASCLAPHYIDFMSEQLTPYREL